MASLEDIVIFKPAWTTLPAPTGVKQRNRKYIGMLGDYFTRHVFPDFIISDMYHPFKFKKKSFRGMLNELSRTIKQHPTF